MDLSQNKPKQPKQADFSLPKIFYLPQLMVVYKVELVKLAIE